uniref:Protein TIFY n=1 Tax=Ananas comosus var. bracteatus TaxID=296719 RepID=A0A6V7QX71_ANACO
MDSGGSTSARALLEKPLAELTEEDIAQLTREDCRRFLKEKGMRRPSWNKSQAIQQVISLKALLEGRPDSATTATRQKPPPPPPPPPPHPPPPPPHINLSSPPKDPSGDSPSPPPKAPSPYRRRDPTPPAFAAGDPSLRPTLAGGNPLPSPENRCFSPRAAAEVPAGQMTIFYDGKINVYDGVMPDKARAIMQLAASPDGRDFGPGPAHSIRPLPPRFPMAFLGPAHVRPAPSAAGIFPLAPAGALGRRSRESVEEWRAPPPEREPETGKNAEQHTGRKASLQRYLEKRKDRFKGKRIVGGSSSSAMEMIYLGQKIQDQASNEQSVRSDTSSLTTRDHHQHPLGAARWKTRQESYASRLTLTMIVVAIENLVSFAQRVANPNVSMQGSNLIFGTVTFF